MAEWGSRKKNSVPGKNRPIAGRSLSNRGTVRQESHAQSAENYNENNALHYERR